MSGPFGSGSFGTGVFSSSPIFTTKDLIDNILRATGHQNPSTETAKRANVLNFINNRYAMVTSSRHWDWLYQTLDFNLDAPYETGTASVTQDSQQVTGSGTLWNANVVPNQYFVPANLSVRYLISDVTSNTAITLEGEYVDATDTGISYKIIKPLYYMPQNLEHVQSIVLAGFGELVPIGTQELRRKQQYNPTLTGTPRYFSEVGRAAADGKRVIEVWPAPDQRYLAQLNYGVNIMKLEDSADNYPLIPDRHRVVLYYGALAEMFAFQKDSVNATSAQTMYEKALMLMQADPQLTDSRLRFQPARDYRQSRRRRRGRRGITDIHDFAREP